MGRPPAGEKQEEGQMFEFGVSAQDKISGFVGVVIGKASYITGCDQYLIQPRMNTKQVREGQKPDAQWFDENRLEEIDDHECVTINTDGPDTGPCDAAPVK